jgi:RNA ligase
VTVNLCDLFDLDLLDRMLKEGFVRAQDHPSANLTILNYTPKAQYSREWNSVTRQCRGLIYNNVYGTVVARPFPKFFNVGELSDEEIPQSPFRVFEKLDGSLGVLYPSPAGWRVATRGSFHSEQAYFATEWMHAHVLHSWRPLQEWTYLFEIIYPENRIVVDYGARRELVLLDVINTVDGRSIRHLEAALKAPVRWPGTRAKEYDGFDALENLLAAEQPVNEEGYVLLFEPGYMRAKVKHDEYVRLHRIVTGVSTKTVWEYLSEGKDFADLLDRVPDEFYDWLQRVKADLQRQYDEIFQKCDRDFDEELSLTGFHLAEDDGGVGLTPQFRKAFALRIKDHPYKDILFRMLDNKRYEDAIWKRLKPVFEKPFMTQSEDVA